MKTKHTPGPWTKEHWVRIKGQGDAPTEIFAGLNKQRVKVGEINFDLNAGLDCQMANANAKLIAAAPDLLEALQDLINHCNISVPKGKMDYRKNAIEAIKRATE